MKRSRLQLLITALLFGATTPAFAQTPGSETSIGRQAQATPATRTVFVKMDDCSGQLIPDTTLSFSSARAGASPPLN